MITTCISFTKRFLYEKLNWSFRANTKSSQKLPKDREQKCYETFVRLGFLIYTEQIHQTLIVNYDQTGIVLVPGGQDHTYEERGAKQVAIGGRDEKRAFTSLISTAITSELLPTESVWTGKSERSLPILQYRERAVAEGHIFSYNPNNYWSSLATMKDYVEKIIKPNRNAIIAKHNLP
ncbi:hypothetical protein HOY82DRAFT_493849 [Tuber indicum]|nr:hypothetical protein HOY82DRAFT_493849 [Tuber indicum]